MGGNSGRGHHPSLTHLSGQEREGPDGEPSSLGNNEGHNQTEEAYSVAL